MPSIRIFSSYLLLYMQLLVLLIIIIHRTPGFVARTTTTPPTDIAQERIKRCKLVLDTVPCEHVQILEQRRDNFLKKEVPE